MAEQTNFYAFQSNISLKRATILLPETTIFIQLREEVMIFLKPSYKNKRFPVPSNLGLSFVERPSNLWAKQSPSIYHM